MPAAGEVSTRRVPGAQGVFAALFCIATLLAAVSPATAKVSAPEISAYAESLGVPQAVATEHLEAQAKGSRVDIVGTLEDKLGDAYAGVWFDNETGDFVVPTATAPARSAVASELSRAGLAGDYRTPHATYSWEELEGAQDQVDRELGAGQYFQRELVQTSLDPQVNAVVVRVAATAAQRERAEISRIARAAPAPVEIRNSKAETLGGRLTACNPSFPTCGRPLRGGVEIGFHNSEKARCSAGFHAIGVLNFNRYLLTAGHCAALDYDPPIVHWDSWDEQSSPGFPKGKPHYLGQLEQHAFPAHDWMKINTTGSWWDQVASPPMVAFWTELYGEGNGGPAESIEEYPIYGEAASYPGMGVCHSGLASGGTCGQVNEVGVTQQWEAGTTYDLVEVVGGCSRPGDSGGPWFANNIAYGLHQGDRFNVGGCEGLKYYSEITLATADLGVRLITAPKGETGGVSGFSPRQAHVTGNVYPAGYVSNYHFQFGTTTAYGSASQLYPAGSTWGPVAADGTLNNLKGNTTYHYRIVTQNAVGTGYGQNQSFTTPSWKPAITPQAPTEVKAGKGKLNAMVNPQGSATSYRFEWGKASEGFPNKVPVPDAGIGSGASDVAASQEITGLKGLTQYHWRVVATNEEGTTTSATQTFTTPDWRPVVTTEKQTGVKVVEEAGQATMHGKVNPKGFDTDYRFEWGSGPEVEAEEFNNSVPAPDAEAGSGEADVAVEELLRPIKGETDYHYRLVAENVEGKTTGEAKVFTTPDWRPHVVVGAAGVGDDSATLVSRIHPRGFATAYYLEWGTQSEFKADEYNNTIEGGEIGGNEGTVELEKELTGLQPHRTYHFRTVAENAEGIRVSEDEAFTPSTSGFVANDYPATLYGTSAGIPFTANFGGYEMVCGVPTFEAGLEQTGPETHEAGTAVLTTTSIGEFSCDGNPVDFSFELNGCNFEFDPGEGHEGSFEGEFNIGPPGCGPISSDNAACPISIPAQIGRAATYTNEGEGGAATVKVSLQAAGLRYSSSGSFFCPATDNSLGALSGSWEIEAEDAENQATDLSVTRAFAVGPEVVTGDAQEVGITEATLHGAIDTLGYGSFYAFQYGTTTEYGEGVSGGEVKGSEQGPEQKSLVAKGLKPGTTYHFRMIGLNQNGISTGEDQVFTTEPGAITEGATGIGPEKATLHAAINPAGVDTAYQFEYGPSVEYGAKAPASPEGLGSGSAFVDVEEAIEGLEPKTTYHYRVAASTEDDIYYGEDQTFSTWGSWTLQPTPNVEQSTLETKLKAVSCPSSEVCVAVGEDLYGGGGAGQVYEGGEWQTAFQGLGTIPRGVDCPTAGFCMAVGENGEGTAWGLRWAKSGEVWGSAGIAVPQVPSGGSELRLHDVSCPTESACTLAGSYKNEAGQRVPLVETWSGGLNWAVQSTPAIEGGTAELLGISCVSPASCVAVGSREGGYATLAMRWDGEEWSLLEGKEPEAEGPTSLEDVSCASAGFCMAAGSYKEGHERWAFTESFDGSAWTLEGTPKPEGAKSSALLGVSCTSASACTAAGRKVTKSFMGEFGVSEEATMALTWDGGEWSVQSTPNPEGSAFPYLADVDCSAASACSAVGWAKVGGEIKTLGAGWNGSSWTLQPTPNVEQSTLETKLKAVSCPSSEVCMAVGEDLYGGHAVGQILEGGEWETVFEADDIQAVRGVDCPTTTMCAVVGEKSAGAPWGLGWKKSGGTWSGFQPAFVPTPSGGSELRLHDVSCPTESACTLAGSYKNEAGQRVPLVETWSGGLNWAVQSTPAVKGGAAELLGISCASTGFCMAVGSKEGGNATLAMRWDGEEWSLLASKDPEAGGERPLEDVSCASTGFCMAVGSYKQGVNRWAYTESFDGSAWALEETPKPEGAKASALLGVSCPTTDFCSAVGRQVTKSAIGDVGVTEEATMALAWDGSAWGVQSTPDPEGAAFPRLADVDCSAAAACSAAGWAKTAASGDEVKTLGEGYE